MRSEICDRKFPGSRDRTDRAIGYQNSIVTGLRSGGSRDREDRAIGSVIRDWVSEIHCDRDRAIGEFGFIIDYSV